MAVPEEGAVLMGTVPLSMEEGILRLESKLQRPLTTDELTRVSTMYQRIDGARASIFKGVCKGRVTPESAGGFENAINGCRAKAWTIVRQKILDAEGRRLRTEADGVDRGVRHAQELLRAVREAKANVGELKGRECSADANGDVEGRASSDFGGGGILRVVSRECDDDDEGRKSLEDAVPDCGVPILETRVRPAKRARLL